jgi:hypothetical protein
LSINVIHKPNCVIYMDIVNMKVGTLLSCRYSFFFTGTQRTSFSCYWQNKDYRKYVHGSCWINARNENSGSTILWHYLLTLHDNFGGVAHLFSFRCCFFVFVCLRPVSCVPNIASVSGLFILDWPFGFL